MKNIEEKISDKELFKQPPPLEDCPICFQQLPVLNTGWRYNTCCGKVICSGCIHAPVYDNQGNEVDNTKCPFCRTPWPNTDEEAIEWLNKRVATGDPIAIYIQGCHYYGGSRGYSQNYTKALELWHRAGELGHAKAFASIGYAYYNGEGVEVNKKKANHYWELAAIGGNVLARRDLGNEEIMQAIWTER